MEHKRCGTVCCLYLGQWGSDAPRGKTQVEMLVDCDRKQLLTNHNLTPVASPRIANGFFRKAQLSSPKNGVVKKSATENSQLHKKQSYRNVGRYSGSFSPPGIFIDYIKLWHKKNYSILGDSKDVRLVYDITTIKEMEGGEHCLQYQSSARPGGGLTRLTRHARLFTPQLQRRDPPPALARHRYDSPLLGGTQRNTPVRNRLWSVPSLNKFSAIASQSHPIW